MANNNFEYRRQAQRVFVDRGTGDVVLRLHQTDIVRVRPNGDVVLCTGGWATQKTLKSMNDALELFGMWVESTISNPTAGRWEVTDSNEARIPYAAADATPLVIRAHDAEHRRRGQWLAEAYQVAYNPPPAAAAAAAGGPRIAAAPAAAGPRVAAAAAAAPSGPRTVAQQPAPAAAAPAAARANGIGGSWANVARQATPTHQATTGAAAAAHPARMTGPGGSAAGRVTGPGAAAAAGPTRPPAPPGFSSGAGASSSGASSSGAAARVTAAPPQPAAWPTNQGGGGGGATVTVAPPAPINQQVLEQHMAQMGIADDDDAHLCVVCMDEPRSIVLVPCGHMALCRDCCQELIVVNKKNCPMCQQAVEYHVEVDA